ncbi:MAG: type IV pilus modification protein PilV [Candidatus Contendobacter sp.]
MAKVINRHGKGAAGFTLLEVLVAVVVLSVGLLGLASLQVNGLQFNHSAYLRTQATLLAEELADRMRANRPGFTANNYDNPSVNPVALVAACRTVAGCTAAQMAQNDLAEWQRVLARVLPNGQGVVCRDVVPIEAASTPAAPSCGGGNTYTIKIWWDDRRADNNLERFVVTL